MKVFWQIYKDLMSVKEPDLIISIFLALGVAYVFYNHQDEYLKEYDITKRRSQLRVVR